MRYQEQLKRLRDCHSQIAVSAVPLKNGNSYQVNNIQSIVTGLKLVEGFDCLDPELSLVKKIEYLENYVSNKLILEKEEYSVLNNSIAGLKKKIKTAIDIIESVIKETNELTISIKIIEHHSLKDIGEELSLFDKILMQAISHKKIDGSYKYLSFDIGSSWINIVVKSAMVLNLIAGIVWSACVIRKKKLEGDLLEQKIKQSKVKTETLEDIKETNKRMLKELLECEAANLMSEFKLDDTNNEYKERLIYSIKELSKLIFEGVEIQPSLLAPEESKNLFPDYNALDTIESKIKMIEQS